METEKVEGEGWELDRVCPRHELDSGRIDPEKMET